MTAAFSIVDLMDDTALTGSAYAGSSWSMWRAVLKAAYGLPLGDGELVRFKEVAGDRDPPQRRVRELWVVAGRRAGKDSAASLIALHAALFASAGPSRRPGERLTVLAIAVDRTQAGIVHGYIRGLLRGSPLLAQLIVAESAESIELEGGIEIVVATNSYRSVRGRSIVCAIFDEVAFFRSDVDASSSDAEVYHAVLPGLVTTGGMLIGISSPYRKAGLLYGKWKKHHGQSGDDVLVVRGPSTTFNPTLPQSVIDAAVLEDPQVAASEWCAEWRSDLAAFIERELVESAVDFGVAVRPPQPRVQYLAFCDSSSGRGDSFVVSVGHIEGNLVVVDTVVEYRPPFDPIAVIREIAELLRAYGVREIWGDAFAVGFSVASFAEVGVVYHEKLAAKMADGTDRKLDKSAIFITALSLFTSGRLRMVEHRRTIEQFCQLERRAFATGRVQVSHPSQGHDDCANAVAGCAVLVSNLLDKGGWPARAKAWAALGSGRDLEDERRAAAHAQTDKGRAEAEARAAAKKAEIEYWKAKPENERPQWAKLLICPVWAFTPPTEEEKDRAVAAERAKEDRLAVASLTPRSMRERAAVRQARHVEARRRAKR
jgi:hypothetical protein